MFEEFWDLKQFLTHTHFLLLGWKKFRIEREEKREENNWGCVLFVKASKRVGAKTLLASHHPPDASLTFNSSKVQTFPLKYLTSISIFFFSNFSVLSLPFPYLIDLHLPQSIIQFIHNLHILLPIFINFPHIYSISLLFLYPFILTMIFSRLSRSLPRSSRSHVSTFFLLNLFFVFFPFWWCSFWREVVIFFIYFVEFVVWWRAVGD